MGAVVSLDGFIADLNGNLVLLFDWYGHGDVAWSFPGTDEEAHSTRVSAGKRVAEDPAAEKPRLEEDAARVNAESPIPLQRGMTLGLSSKVYGKPLRIHSSEPATTRAPPKTWPPGSTTTRGLLLPK